MTIVIKWHGWKHIVSSIKVNCILSLDAVQSARGATEADILNVMGRFLKYAPDRKGGAGRQTQKLVWLLLLEKYTSLL